MLHSQKLESLGVLAGGCCPRLQQPAHRVLGSAGLALELLPENEPVRSLIKHIDVLDTAPRT